jgi:hypothetical protein
LRTSAATLGELALLLLARLAHIPIGPGRVAPVRPGRGLTDPAVVALRLNRLRDLHHVTQALVLDERTLINFGQPIILPAGQYKAVSAQLDAPIRVLPYLDIPIDQLSVLRRIVQQIHHAVVLHCERLRYFPRFTPRQHQIEILINPQGPVRVEIALWGLRKARVVRRDERRCVGVGLALSRC